MKILLITDNYFPEANALANRSTSHAKFWSKKDKVFVITCFPNHPMGKKFKKYSHFNLFKKEVHGNLTVLRIWSFISKKDNSVLNFLDYLSFGISSFFLSLFIKCDVVIGSSPPLPVAFFTMLSAKIKGTKVFIEIRDMWVDSIKELNLSKSKFLINILYFLEKIMLKNANKILCVTESIKKEIIKKGISENKVLLRPNGFTKKNQKNKKLNKELKVKKNYINILFYGTIGLSQDFTIILKAAKYFEKEVYFYIIGNGSQINQIINQIKTYKVKNIIIKQLNEKKLNNNIYKNFDFGLSSLKNKKVFKTVIPSKLYDYSANKLPIFFIGPKGDAFKLIKEFSLGIYSKPELKDVVKNIKIMIKNKNHIKNLFMKKNKKFKLIFNRENVAKNILNDIYKF